MHFAPRLLYTVGKGGRPRRRPGFALDVEKKGSVSMNRMPDWLKWLVILFVFIVLAGLMLAVNDRASRVDMPEPDNTFGIYRSSSESDAG